MKKLLALLMLIGLLSVNAQETQQTPTADLINEAKDNWYNKSYVIEGETDVRTKVIYQKISLDGETLRREEITEGSVFIANQDGFFRIKDDVVIAVPEALGENKILKWEVESYKIVNPSIKTNNTDCIFVQCQLKQDSQGFNKFKDNLPNEHGMSDAELKNLYHSNVPSVAELHIGVEDIFPRRIVLFNNSGEKTTELNITSIKFTDDLNDELFKVDGILDVETKDNLNSYVAAVSKAIDDKSMGSVEQNTTWTIYKFAKIILTLIIVLVLFLIAILLILNSRKNRQ